MTEDAVTPEEARTALEAIAKQLGVQLMPDNVNGRAMQPAINYDARADHFVVIGRSIADGKKRELTVYGETVAKAVRVARALRGTPGKALRRRSVKERRARQVAG